MILKFNHLEEEFNRAIGVSLDDEADLRTRIVDIFLKSQKYSNSLEQIRDSFTHDELALLAFDLLFFIQDRGKETRELKKYEKSN